MVWNKGLGKEDERVSKYSREGKEHSQWKGGYSQHSDGYMYIHRELIEPEFYPMLEKSNYVLLHRYVMAKHLGRCLDKSEIVHHMDEDKNNNEIQNLELTTRAEHMKNIHPELIKLANESYRRKKVVEQQEINNQGIVTAQQAADILSVPHSTIRRRQERKLLSDIKTVYNGRCLYLSELTDNAHLWRKSPKKKGIS